MGEKSSKSQIHWDFGHFLFKKRIVSPQAQDLSPLMRRFALGCLEEGGHMLAVGDESQSIYAFAGAYAEPPPSPLSPRITYVRIGVEKSSRIGRFKLCERWAPNVCNWLGELH